MNQKKCPKCGEMNPGEAVMCWACYTPLTGAAVGAGGVGTAAMATPGVAAQDDNGGKKVIAPWQMGVVGVGLLLALGLGAKTMMSGPTEDPITPTGGSGGIIDPSKQVTGGRTTTGVPVPPPPPPSSGGGSTVPPDPTIPYKIAVPPNPASAWGVMAIVPNNGSTGPARAAALASFARQQQQRSGNWKAMHVYVFQDMESANRFKQFQVPRRSEALLADDYATLIDIWPRCIARYEYNGGRESIRYPSQAPNSWWLGG